MPKYECLGRTDSEQKSSLSTRRRIYIRRVEENGDRIKNFMIFYSFMSEYECLGRTDSEQKTSLSTRRRIYIRREGENGDRIKNFMIFYSFMPEYESPNNFLFLLLIHIVLCEQINISANMGA